MQLIPFTRYTHCATSNREYVRFARSLREYNPVEIYNPKTIISIIWCFAVPAKHKSLKRKYCADCAVETREIGNFVLIACLSARGSSISGVHEKSSA